MGGGVAGRGEGKGGKKLSRVSFPHASDALPGLSAPPQGRLHPPAGLAASRHSLSPTSCKSGCSVPRPAVSSFGAGALRHWPVLLASHPGPGSRQAVRNKRSPDRVPAAPLTSR